MQKEVISSVNLTIAKLELKQLEVIDKLSRKIDDEYIIRCVTCPDTNNFIAVNGDWETVIGVNEYECIGLSIFDFLPDYEKKRVAEQVKVLMDGNEFNSFVCDLIDKDGLLVSVDWRSKYFAQINSIVSIGRVSK
jgi:PAS domain-containing protein